MDNKKIIELTEKYTKGLCTEEEMILLENWYLNWVPEKISISETELNQARSEVFSKLPVQPEPGGIRFLAPKRYLWRRIAVAAAMLLMTGGGWFYYKYNKEPLDEVRALELASKHIGPGSNKAYLTLANGRRISLTDEPDGVLDREGGVEIFKTSEGKLIYKIRERSPIKHGPESRNKIETPNGGQYQVYLPDGTKIWLNAASSIAYAPDFTSAGERNVELIGEAYFEVAKDKKHPFIVKCPGQEVRVLGTHFNINAYKENHQVKTTLTEGSVRVVTQGKDELGKHDVMLKPGQQSVLAGGKIQVVPSDIEADLAWKEGLFVFRDESLENIMRQIARWYDVEVIFEGDIASKHFEGTISRFKNISEVLRKFQLTKNVHFKIEGRRVTVMP